jgi:hypothetical protein
VISLFATVAIGGQITPAISVDTQSMGVSQVRVGMPDGVRVGAAVAVSLQAGNVSSLGVTIPVK